MSQKKSTRAWTKMSHKNILIRRVKNKFLSRVLEREGRRSRDGIEKAPETQGKGRVMSKHVFEFAKTCCTCNYVTTSSL